MKIGDWWCNCCIHDLQQIVTDEDLQEAEKEFSNDWGLFEGPWRSKEEAVHALVQPTRYVMYTDAQYEEECRYAEENFGVSPLRRLV